MEWKLDGNCSRILRAVLNKSWRQHSTKQKLYEHLPAIAKTIQTRRARHFGHCWKSKDEHISDVLLWTLSHGRARLGRPARPYLQKICTDTGCNMEDLPKVMDDRDKWLEKVREISASTTPWWLLQCNVSNSVHYLSYICTQLNV